MNAALLHVVQRAIARAPDRFCAAQWAFARNADEVLRSAAEPDGFRCCIAGQVLLHSGTLDERGLLREGGFHTGGALWDHAAEAAGLTDAQARTLFFPSQWDRPYKQRYYLCGRDEEAALAVEYIDYFLEQHGATGSPEETGSAAASRPAPSRHARSPDDRPPAAGPLLERRRAPAR
jgi:hypothetical protein